MAVVFVKRGDELVPCFVESGFIIDIDELESQVIDAENLRETLEKLTKQALVNVMKRNDGLVADKDKEKERMKMTKVQLVSEVENNWENIIRTTTRFKLMFSIRNQLSSALDKFLAPLETATKGMREEIKSDGKRTIVLMNKYDKPTITRGFRVFYLNGTLHISTAEGCYSAPDDILSTENVVLLNRDDKKEEEGEEEEEGESDEEVEEGDEKAQQPQSSTDGQPSVLDGGYKSDAPAILGTARVRVVKEDGVETFTFDYTKDTCANVIFDFFKDLGLEDGFTLKFETADGSSQLFPYDCLNTYFCDNVDATITLTPTLAGGAGGGVRKHFLKVKGELDKNITPADATKFQEAFNACTKVLSATSFDLKKSFQEMPLSDLKSLQTYLESGLGTNAVKMGNIGEYLMEQKHIQYAQEKLLVCSKVIKDFVSADITATYGNRIEKVKTTLAVVIGIKEGDEQL